MKNKISIHNSEKLRELIIKNWYSNHHYNQIENAIYKNLISQFDLMDSLSKDLRDILQKNCFYSSLELDTLKNSSNWKTSKLLFKTSSGEFIESVIIRHLTWRVTLCISCQAGCPMACCFCATGKLGFLKNLETYEMIEQIMYAIKLLQDEWNTLRNIVFMGMWEPMLNYPNVKKACEIITEQKKLNLANRRVTVSTCWIVPNIKKLARDFPQISLAVSLHAPNDKIRKLMMPVNYTYPIKELMKSLDYYVRKTNKKIFYEYIMINWINDNIKLASELWELLKWKLAHVNFIPYNAWQGINSEGFKATPRFIIEKFQTILKKYSIASTIRTTMWDDIDAACGQLANK